MTGMPRRGPLRLAIALVVAVGVAAAVLTPDVEAETGLEAERGRELEKKLVAEAEAIVAEYGFPGMTVAVAGPGGIATVAAGVADRERALPMTPATTMLAASIGKTLVAATVLQLAEEGRLGLDDPLSRWLGDRDWFAQLPGARAITLRHLLQHRSGLRDHVQRPAFAELWPRRLASPRPEDLIALLFDTDLLFPPGEGWSYTDTGYLLLGLVVEAVTGDSYEEVIHRRFIGPLALRSTGPSNTRRLPGLARGYLSPEPGLDLPPVTTDDSGAMLWSPAVEWTGGGLYTTSRDLAVWGRAFLSGRLLAAAIWEQAVMGAVDANADGSLRYGLGVAIRQSAAFGPVYGHRGWIPGYVSSLQYYPARDLAIAFQINTDVGIIDTDRPVQFLLEERLAKQVFPAER